MTRRGLIDTSVLIAGLPAHIIDVIERYCSSTIVRAELVQGQEAFRADAAQGHRARRREELIATLDSLPSFWHDFDTAASDAYGALTAEPKSAMRLKDALIAAHALALGVPVVTRDRGFSRFAGVETVFVDD